MQSSRLIYEPVSAEKLSAFHSLIRDEHVRRYLCDGEVFSLEWCLEQIEASRELFNQRGYGIWLVHEDKSHQLMGFCGFLVIPSITDEPQLVYALLERWTGQGYATEMAQAAIEEARKTSSNGILASVDAINAASYQILRKLGFIVVETQQGAFGDMLILRID